MSDRGRSPSPSGQGGPSGSERRPSQSPSRQASPSRSAASGPSSSGAAAAAYKQPLGYDPAKPPAKEERGNTRMELPPDAYLTDTKKDVFTLRGKQLNTDGQSALIDVNQYRMMKFDFGKKIYQYDIQLSPEPDKLGPVMKKIWSHDTVKKALQPYKGDRWLHDGKKLAWAPVLVDRGELRMKVDLDEGRRPPGAKAREGGNFHVTIRKVTEIKVSALQGYLEHKMSFDNTVQESLNFLDHLVRQWPSEHLLAIKRNFYKQDEKAGEVISGGYIEVHKGSYASIRMSHNLAKKGVGLGYNIDVANTCFWVKRSFTELLLIFLASNDNRWRGKTPITIQSDLRPIVREKDGRLESSDAFKQLRKLRKLRFTVRHRDRRNQEKVLTAVDFHFDEKCGPDGANARNTTFDYNGKQISVQEYYRQKYNVTLQFAGLPLINAGRAGFIPMEFAFIEPMQRYPFKLTPDQTADMIKIAVTRPPVRRKAIEDKFAQLDTANDPYLKEYGVSFETRFAQTEARILPAPSVKFAAKGTAEPKFAGRWDLRGKKFWMQNRAPLQAWGFLCVERGAPLPALKQFADTFKATFMGHGGKVLQEPVVLDTPGNIRMNAAQVIQWGHEQVKRVHGYTQLLFVVVSAKNSGNYERIKKSADCRFGILTQVVVLSHVMKNNGQYHSNVCMKVNAKMGGATSCTPQLWKTPTYFPEARPTMIIGVDVSHAAPGGTVPSTAAMTMSIDRDATRYAALVETNGYRTEILTTKNVRSMFGQLAALWRPDHKNAMPAHILYFRDGVGEGQFQYVLNSEVAAIKTFLSEKAPGKPLPKFTVIVATKRHHIRFFPQRGDKNGNPLPGTLVEKEVTHPFMYDFYLCSHVAIQGTARPVHYHVILDEQKLPVNELQRMIYQQSYSYARSTTPVSLHPAVYYAHLASNRARAHENIAVSEGYRSGPKGHEVTRDKVAKGQSVGGPHQGVAPPDLLTLGGKIDPTKGPEPGEERQRNFFRGTMWFI
ncbi:hypothetical protein G7046_g9055 [Stylonectria norvegica]|nr:hypothetical protein G7046_g9055 [Stylonectria norvegica]